MVVAQVYTIVTPHRAVCSNLGIFLNGNYMSVELIKKQTTGAPGWRSRLSVRLQPGHDLALHEFEPRVGLWADGSEPGACSDSVSPSLSDPPPFMLCLSLSQK